MSKQIMHLASESSAADKAWGRSWNWAQEQSSLPPKQPDQVQRGHRRMKNMSLFPGRAAVLRWCGHTRPISPEPRPGGLFRALWRLPWDKRIIDRSLRYLRLVILPKFLRSIFYSLLYPPSINQCQAHSRQHILYVMHHRLTRICVPSGFSTVTGLYKAA